jgi:hypothetical protein
MIIVYFNNMERNMTTFNATFLTKSEFETGVVTARDLMQRLTRKNQDCRVININDISDTGEKLSKLDRLVVKINRYLSDNNLVLEGSDVFKKMPALKFALNVKMLGGYASYGAFHILPAYGSAVALTYLSLSGQLSQSFELTREDIMSNVAPVVVLGTAGGVMTGCIFPSKDRVKDIISVANNAFWATAFLLNATMTAPYLSGGLDHVSPDNSINKFAAGFFALAGERVLRLCGGY